MKRLIILVVLSLFSLAATGETLKGKVTNGTTKKPAAGDEVQLKKPGDSGMQDIAQTRTNAKGEFTFQSVEANAAYVVWVKHQNVLFTESVRAGGSTAEIQVYDVSPKVQGAEQTDESLILQADNNGMRVMELVTVVNNSDPPKAQPNFEVYLPEGAKILDGSASQQDKMPMRKAPVPTDEKNKYVFNYPVRPGETHFDLTYDLPYTGKLDFDPRLTAPMGKLFVVMPKSLHFTPASAAAYEHSDQWPHAPGLKDISVQIARDPKPGDKLAFQINGTGVFDQGDAGGQGEDTRPGGGLGVPNERPDPISGGGGGQWAFLGVLTFFLAGGAAFLFITAKAGAQVPAPARRDGAAPLLEALKEEMFQLETDRLHGKVTPQEYDVAKSALDKTLQRAMKRKK